MAASTDASRDDAIAAAHRYFDEGGFFADLARRVAIPTSSREAVHRKDLRAYLGDEIAPCLARLDYQCELFDNPVITDIPFLIAQRHEAATVPTVLTYGHGDVVPGLATEWADGLDPWRLTRQGERLYGRGTADNKGQHTINIAAIEAVLTSRGRLGFNSTILIETGEEIGSPGLAAFCEYHRARLSADVLIGSDGPRLSPGHASMFMGTRGAINFTLTLDLRDEGHHSGNWGGLIANPGVILAHALTTLVGPRGEILVPELKPAAMPNSVRDALANCIVEGGDGAPAIDPDWGEPGLSPVERVFGWNAFEILAYTTGHPAQPVNAIPPRAQATCQIRFTVDTDPDQFLPAIRRHLEKAGFGAVQVEQTDMTVFQATRLDPDHPMARWAAGSIAATIGKPAMVVPNLGGSLPNDVFADLIGMPTIWVPHSYAGCCQHAANEHLLEPIVREGLGIMAGLYWDVGATGFPAPAG